MALTSQLRAGFGLGEVEISGWRAAGLLKPSVVKPVFATFERALIIRRLGTLAAADRVALANAIAQVIGGETD